MEPGTKLQVMLGMLGIKLHPESVTEAWYAADCPPELDARAAGIPLRVRVQWRVSRLLRRLGRNE
jgi:hypothetical protein